mgnify:CR=1 FL=1
MVTGSLKEQLFWALSEGMRQSRALVDGFGGPGHGRVALYGDHVDESEMVSVGESRAAGAVLRG